MPTIKIENLNIQYRQAGSGDIPLVFVHGNYASSRWWLPQFERLPPNVQAFAPDLRGCGTPDGITQTQKQQDGRITIQDLSNDLEKFIITLNLENPILIGHSLGGVIAMDFALRYPNSIRGLLLEDTGPPNGVPAGFLAQSLLLPLEFGSKILMRNALMFAGIPRRGHLAKDLVQDALAASPGQYLAFAQAVSNWDVESELPSLDIPILFVWGGKDRIMSPGIAQQYLRLLPQAALLTIPDAGHSPHLERPNAFAGALKQFVDQCVSQPENTIEEVSPRSLVDRVSRWIRISIFGS